jgi:predicted Abi (CAAX) family protease
MPSAVQTAISEWQAGDRALVLHVYGGIGGPRKEPAAATPIFFGHFAFGSATVVPDPLTEELRFDIRYYQIYTHNTDGLVAGTLHWSRYMGDRQLGWLGNRPTCDILVKLDPFTRDYNFDGKRRSPLRQMESFLQAMSARYRIGDGTGGTYVGPANNCSQDSNRALFASLQQLGRDIEANQDWLLDWAKRHPAEAERFRQLIPLGKQLKRALQPFGQPRPDWEANEFNLGSTLEDSPFRNLAIGLTSWRTLLPRKANDTIVKVFLRYGASVWVLRTNQVGGEDREIAPIAPMTL